MVVAEAGILVLLFVKMVWFILLDAEDVAECSDQTMSVEEFEFRDMTYVFQEDLCVGWQINLDYWHVYHNLKHGQESPEVQHVAVQEERNEELKKDNREESDGLSVSSCFQSRLVDTFR